METKAYFINLKVSPKKARFYLPAIKKMKPAESLEFLMYESTDAAVILYKVIKSAISSAKQILKVEDNLLNFKLLSVEQGQKLKRYRPGSRGNAKPINRRMSHIKIILEAIKTPVKPVKSVKSVESVKSVKSVKPVKSVKSVESVKSVKSVKPVKSVKSVKKVKKLFNK